MIVANMISGIEGLEIQYQIRERVFIKEQGIDPRIEMDEIDEIAMHVLVYQDDIPVATGRIYYDYPTDQYLIGRVAVLPEYRGRKYGDLAVRKLIDYGFRHGAKEIRLHSQKAAIDFYKKIGFEPIGSVYEEAGIAHQTMRICEAMIQTSCGAHKRPIK